MPQEFWEAKTFLGLITSVSPEDLKSEFSQDPTENLITNEIKGAMIRRRGNVSEYKWTDTPAHTGPIKSLFPVGEKQQILASTLTSNVGVLHNSLSSYGVMTKGGGFNQLIHTPAKDQKWRFAEYDGVVYIATGVYPLAYWTEADGYIRAVGGNPLTRCQDFPAYSVPWAKHIAVHKDTMFVGNLSGHPDGVQFSAIQDLETPVHIVAPYEAGAWQGTNKQTLGNGDDVTNIISYGANVIITQHNHIWMVSGEYPQYFWQELRLDSGDTIGAIEDTLQVRDGILYGADEKCIWAFNGSSLKNITEDTIKSKYQDRTKATGFPLIDMGSLYIHEQKAWQNSTYDHSIDLEFAPGVVQLADFRNMDMSYMNFTNPEFATDGEYSNKAVHIFDNPNMGWIGWEFVDPWKRDYALVLSTFMIHYKSETTMSVWYRHCATAEWTNTGVTIPSTSSEWTFSKITITGVDLAVGTAVGGIQLRVVELEGDNPETVEIANMWFCDGVLTSQTAKTCKAVLEWGHLEADIKLANNLACEKPEHDIFNPINGVKIELTRGAGYEEIKRGALITLGGTGDIGIKWRITLHDADNETNNGRPQAQYPNYPKVYAIKLNWLKTGSDWTHQPVAQSWDDKLYFSFPHTGDNRRLLVLDSDLSFHIYPCRNSISSFCVFDNNLYGGKTLSSADGHAEILKLDTGLLDKDSDWIDGEGVITAKRRSKEWRLKDSRRQFELKRYNIILENKEGTDKTFTVYYVVDGVSRSKTFTALANTEKPYNIKIPAGTHGYKVYFEEHLNFDFQIKDITIEANILSLEA